MTTMTKTLIPAERGNYPLRYALMAEAAEGAPRQTVPSPGAP